MENIARTNDGGYLVKFSEQEFKALARLERAVSGNGFTPWIDQDIPYVKNDINHVFDAIRIWTITKFHVNEMHEAVEALDRIMLKKDSGDGLQTS